MKNCLIITLAIIALLIPAQAFTAIPRYSTNSNDFVSAGYPYFWVNGRPFRFMGYNIRGLVNYGDGQLLGGSETTDREQDLICAYNVGAKVARVFLSSRFSNTQTISDRLNTALQLASQYDVRLIVAFTDEYYTNFCPPGDGDYYGYNGDGILNQSFFSGGYLNNYWPLVQSVVTRYKDDPTVFAWQLGNELKCPWSPSAIMPFCQDMAARIRGIDTRHMLSYGTAGRNFSGLSTTQATQLYQDFSFLTVHAYNGDDSNNDISLAASLGKPLLVSEAGWEEEAALEHYPSRCDASDADIQKWIDRGASGYMNWGFTAVDNGDGDDIFGIDPFNHSYDWNEYTDLYTRWSADLADTPMPTPNPPTIVAASDGKWADRIEITWSGKFLAKEYAVFRAASSTGIKTQISPWITGFSYFDLSVVRGTRYYYWVKARNEDAESAFSIYDIGYSLAVSELNIAQVRQKTGGYTYYVTGGVVTAVFGNGFYMEQPDRTAAIFVVWSGVVNEGDRVNVLGLTGTMSNKERKLTATSVVVNP